MSGLTFEKLEQLARTMDQMLRDRQCEDRVIIIQKSSYMHRMKTIGFSQEEAELAWAKAVDERWVIPIEQD